MQTIRIAICVVALCLGSCQSKQEEKAVQEQTVAAPATATNATEMPTATMLIQAAEKDQPEASTSEPADDAAMPARQFIRTADVKFRVDNVAKATANIEKITAQQAGFVVFTKLDSQIDDKETVPVSADSLLETTRFTVSNTMTLRVPNAHLDTTLRAIELLANYVDIREIKSDDVALQRLADDQTRRRTASHDKRLQQAIDRRGRKLGDIVEAENSRLNGQRESDEAQIDDLSLADKIQYSTVTLSLYQRQTVWRTLLPNITDVREYQPGFFTRAVGALITGADVLTEFVLFLLKSWGIGLFAVVVFVLVKLGIRRWRLVKV